PRDDPPAENGKNRGRLLPPQVRGRYPDGVQGGVRAAGRRGLPGAGERYGRDDARRAAAGGPAVGDLLRAAVSRGALYITFSREPPASARQQPVARSPGGRGQKKKRARAECARAKGPGRQRTRRARQAAAT